jgi:hypothetical protein
MSYQVSVLFHQAWGCRVLVITSISATHQAACKFPHIINHGGGLVTLYRNFNSVKNARHYQDHIKRLYVSAWSKFPAQFVQTVLSFYNKSAALPTVSGQLSLF